MYPSHRPLDEASLTECRHLPHRLLLELLTEVGTADRQTREYDYSLDF